MGSALGDSEYWDQFGEPVFVEIDHMNGRRSVVEKGLQRPGTGLMTSCAAGDGSSTRQHSPVVHEEARSRPATRWSGSGRCGSSAFTSPPRRRLHSPVRTRGPCRYRSSAADVRPQARPRSSNPRTGWEDRRRRSAAQRNDRLRQHVRAGVDAKGHRLLTDADEPPVAIGIDNAVEDGVRVLADHHVASASWFRASLATRRCRLVQHVGVHAQEWVREYPPSIRLSGPPVPNRCCSWM